MRHGRFGPTLPFDWKIQRDDFDFGPLPDAWFLTTEVRPPIAYVHRGYGEAGAGDFIARASGWYAIAERSHDQWCHYGPFRTWVGAARFFRRHLSGPAALRPSFAGEPQWWWDGPIPKCRRLARQAIPPPIGPRLRVPRPRRASFPRPQTPGDVGGSKVRPFRVRLAQERLP